MPFSTVDWSGVLAAVVFVAGCPWRCHYCHNPHLQSREGSMDWHALVDFLASRKGLLEGVVFSGGEPLSEPTLPMMIETAKTMGYRVGLHTAGIYPARLGQILPMLDWVGFDVKTTIDRYDALTGRLRSAASARISLSLLLDSGCEFECRTTWDPNWLPEAELVDLAQILAGLGVKHYAVQNYRAAPGLAPQHSLTDAAITTLHGYFETFTYR